MRANRILGLAVEERSMLVIELRVAGGHCALSRSAEFAFPEGASLDEPADLGAALREFLREHRFTARHAVLGMPARWLLVKEKSVPPASDEALVGLLRIEAEQDFSTDLGDLAFDYAAGPASGDARCVLLLGTLRRKLDQLTALAEAARLAPKAVTPSALALASAVESDAAGLLLYLRPGNADLVVGAHDRFRTITHLPVSRRTDEAAWGRGIANQVRRVVSLVPGVPPAPEPRELVVWDGAGLDGDILEELRDVLSLDVKRGAGLAALDVAAPTDEETAKAGRFAAAVALAQLGARGRLPVDFLHSRLTPKRTSWFGRRAIWAAGAGVALVVLAILFVSSWHEDEEHVVQLKQRVDAMQADVLAAQSVVDKVSYARGWFDRRPEFLEFLREVTLTFPEEGSIWTSSLAIKEDMRAVIGGRALNERAVLEVQDRLKASPAFTDVQVQDMRKATGETRHVSFLIKLSFVRGRKP